MKVKETFSTSDAELHSSLEALISMFDPIATQISQRLESCSISDSPEIEGVNSITVYLYPDIIDKVVLSMSVREGNKVDTLLREWTDKLVIPAAPYVRYTWLDRLLGREKEKVERIDWKVSTRELLGVFPCSRTSTPEVEDSTPREVTWEFNVDALAARMSWHGLG